LAVGLLRNGRIISFALCWLLTITLGAIFLLGTFQEWRHLIRDDGLTIETSLFGTTYYSLVGLHAFHVAVGLLALAIVMAFTVRGDVGKQHADRAEVLSMYWHFVDVVWVAVFTVVYIVGR
jgi:cytochrome c oxidase subunit 3/cytochrome o ubiquinol oxidase subunit 3